LSVVLFIGFYAEPINVCPSGIIGYIIPQTKKSHFRTNPSAWFNGKYPGIDLVLSIRSGKTKLALAAFVNYYFKEELLTTYCKRCEFSIGTQLIRFCIFPINNK